MEIRQLQGEAGNVRDEYSLGAAESAGQQEAGSRVRRENNCDCAAWQRRNGVGEL